MSAAPSSASTIWNVPNILTFARILFAITIFALMPFGFYKAALVLFIFGTISDFLDGWWARHFHQITKLGRITDPFADKLLVCGTLIYLVTIPELTSIRPLACCPWNLGLAPWMVVAVISRELLVTLLRSMVEGSGGNFSAKWLGKWKMALQCVGIIGCFLYIIYPEESVRSMIVWPTILALWGMVYLAFHSCVNYIRAAISVSKNLGEKA